MTPALPAPTASEKALEECGTAAIGCEPSHPEPDEHESLHSRGRLCHTFQTHPNPVREAGRWLKRARLRAMRALAPSHARWNSELCQREIWQGRTRLDSTPCAIQIGTNWTCNLHCVFCRRETLERERLAALPPEEREISPEAIRRILPVLRYAESVTLTPLGEPLMYSGLEDLVGRCHAAGCRNLELTTNGNLLDNRRVRLLTESGVFRRLYISVDSADPARYAAMRVGGTLERVTEGLRRLAEARGGTDLSTGIGPEVILAATFLASNVADLPGLVAYAHTNGVRTLSVQLMEAEAPEFEPDTLGHHLPLAVRSIDAARSDAARLGVRLLFSTSLRHLLSHAASPESRTGILPVSGTDAPGGDETGRMPVLLSPQAGNPSGSAEREPDPASRAIAARLLADEPALDIRSQSLLDRCSSPWKFLVVDTDGGARPCVWAGIGYGNLAHQEWDEIWNGENAQRLRRQFLAGEAPAGCVGRPCRIFE